MQSWVTTLPFLRTFLCVLGLFFAFFLIRFVVRQVFIMLKMLLALGLILIGLFFYLDYSGYFNGIKTTIHDVEFKLAKSPAPKAASIDLTVESESQQTTPRQLFAQIVDTEDKDTFLERAMIEGHPFKYLLKRVSKTSREQIVKDVNDRTTFENLTDEPELHRGEAYAPGRGVIVEVTQADLGPEYGLPGWSVLPAVFVNTAHEIYALRILCPAGSNVFEKLSAGIKDDKLPVVNLAGYFFKNYARQPGDPKEQPWIKPLLVCPEIQFVQGEEPREVMSELRDTGYARMLPTKRVEAPGAELRLVIDAVSEKDTVKFRAWGIDSGADVKAFVTDAIATLKKHLPAEHAAQPAAVIVTRGALKEPQLQPLIDALKAAGVKRICVKLDVTKPSAATPGK
ncbi:MAG: hypothetical protein WCT04_13070 [Planctomycetota bacterium]